MAISEEDYVREHAALLGRAKLVWNDCHDAVFFIFHDLSGMTWEKSTDVFFSLKTGRSARRPSSYCEVQPAAALVAVRHIPVPAAAGGNRSNMGRVPVFTAVSGSQESLIEP